MNQEEIRKKWESIDRKESKLAKQLAKLQTLCKHPSVTKTYQSNTGNYDRTADSYWIDYKCADCGKRWQEDQK